MLDAAASRFPPLRSDLEGARKHHHHVFDLPLSTGSTGGRSRGQFLTIRVPDSKGGHVLRNYTVSSSPREEGTYRITVKREAAPSQRRAGGCEFVLAA